MKTVRGTISLFLVVGVLFGVYAIAQMASNKTDHFWWMDAGEQRKAGLHKLTLSEKKALNAGIIQLFALIHMKDSLSTDSDAVQYLRNQGELEDAAVEYLEDEGELKHAAVKYLKDNGWDEVTVLGTREIKSEDYLIVQKGYTTYILEPRGYFNSYSWARGNKYFGNMGYTSCEIIDSDGSTADFWTEDTE